MGARAIGSMLGFGKKKVPTTTVSSPVVKTTVGSGLGTVGRGSKEEKKEN